MGAARGEVVAAVAAGADAPEGAARGAVAAPGAGGGEAGPAPAKEVGRGPRSAPSVGERAAADPAPEEVILGGVYPAVAAGAGAVRGTPRAGARAVPRAQAARGDQAGPFYTWLYQSGEDLEVHQCRR